ncbi:NAD(P)-binding protein [Saitoella complicata NRRL Y-17804]|uniref:NmrA-like domain-containing protein n=1 Tax=Saitoella complicata (strain BCRC 22490 / CBS 7301 / JCM 7358 / NBRC 10748 / NRRL Y-17804) TaxID=698492 RepID=A0A0E9NQK7_SAICN|nr:NAD(P)-binding protein [Saitoella complicata NRRL Y-17804]ODQ56381.1 NAD(P)-binding protein [Saitoella complicata NRRL Y-17804]GAO52078.1 hypothetical protein G7K_6164-t1 [Saitoella complicata NRRL Y-17804]
MLAAPLRLGSRSAVKTPVASAKRNVHDIMISRTGKPIIRQGGGGRSSLSGHTATVFGATGFLGRYIVSKLAKQGTTVVIPWRDEDAKRHLKVSGDLGQVVMHEFDLRNTESIESAVRHSDIVYNLIGRDWETKNFKFHDVHIDGAARIAESCAKYDVDRLVHVSALNADEHSPSEFYRTKAQAENIVRGVFPEATIVRPSTMYGAEDRFLNVLASKTTHFSSNSQKAIVRPTHVADVAEALEYMMHNDWTAAQTFELYGKEELSVAEVAEMVRRVTLKKHRNYNIPSPIMKQICKVLELAWWPIYSPDQVAREFINDTPTQGAKTFADLGITPAEFEHTSLTYLRSYRSNLYFDQPMDASELGKFRKGEVHVVD